MSMSDPISFYCTVKGFLDENRVPYKENFRLKYDTYFKMGGVVKFFISPSTVEDMVAVVKYFNVCGLEYKVVGLTTNVFFLDQLEYGLVITTRNLTQVTVEGNRFEVECGYALGDFVRSALINGYCGIEGLEGVPGSMGGALAMNAGAYGYTISDHLRSVKCLDKQGELVELGVRECGFHFRESIFKNSTDYVILSSVFELPVVERREAARRIEIFHIARHSYQEFAFPNLGSMFSVRGDFYREIFASDSKYKIYCYVLKLVLKNPFSKFLSRKRPNNKFFNRLAYRYLGMRGLKYQASDKSMNILINDGVCTLDDTLEYIRTIRANLKSSTPIENEIVISALWEGERQFEIVQKIIAQEL